MKPILSRLIAFTFALILFPQIPYSLSEDELKELYLQVAESAVDAFEPIWVDESDRIPNSAFTISGNTPIGWTIPSDDHHSFSNGPVQFCYAVLLNETDKEYFGRRGFPGRLARARHQIHPLVLPDQFVCGASVSYVPATQRFATAPIAGNIRGARRSNWMTLAAGLLWNDLTKTPASRWKR